MDTTHSIELRYLRSFIALGEELNFRRAAERVHVTTSALSMQIRKLEELLNVRLCERDTTHVRLTEQGKMLLRKAKELMEQMHQAVEATQKITSEKRVSLNLGYPGWSSHPFIAEVVSAYQENSPKVEVALVNTCPDSSQMEAVAEGRLDVGFIRNVKPRRFKGLKNLLISEVPLCVLMSARHPLAAARAPLTLAEVVKHPVLHEQDYCCVSRLHEFFREKHVKPRSITVVSGINAWLVMLMKGEGVSIMHKNRFFTSLTGLVQKPIKDAIWSQAYAIWKNNTKSPHVLEFVERLRRAGVRRT